MIRRQKIVYESDSQKYEGLLAWDDALSGLRPGVMVVHTFKGQGEFENGKAEDLARLGYIAMAIDLYGQGRRADTPEVATQMMNELNHDRALLLARIRLALESLKQQPKVDANKLAAIGFCFGGKCVLDLARSGAEIKGVVSFHGIYDAPNLPDQNIHASVLVLHGWEDPLAQPPQVMSLAAELTDKQADWQILAFGNTGHAFTNRMAADRAGGMFYMPTADQRSWQAMVHFLNEQFT